MIYQKCKVEKLLPGHRPLGAYRGLARLREARTQVARRPGAADLVLKDAKIPLMDLRI